MMYRYFSETLHKKPHALQHPLEVWKHTAFEHQEEMDAFLNRSGTLGRPTSTQPQNGMKQSYHDFADKMWLKFKLLRREIASQTQALWAQLVPGNKLPSGLQMPEIVASMLKGLFKKWQVEPTSKGSKTVYCSIEMTDKGYENWRPTWWAVWREMGPPAGAHCSAVFMSECCGFKAICTMKEPEPAAYAEHFRRIEDGAEVSNVSGGSRRELAAARLVADKKDRSSAKSPSSDDVPSLRLLQNGQIIDIERAKEQRIVRQEEIERLKYLLVRHKDDNARTVTLQKQLDDMYECPWSTPSPSLLAPATPSAVETPFSPVSKIQLQVPPPKKPSTLAAAPKPPSVHLGHALPQALVSNVHAVSHVSDLDIQFVSNPQGDTNDSETATADDNDAIPVQSVLVAAAPAVVSDDSEFAVLLACARDVCRPGVIHVQRGGNESNFTLAIAEARRERLWKAHRSTVLSKHEVEVIHSSFCIFSCFAEAFIKEEFKVYDSTTNTSTQFDATVLKEMVSEEVELLNKATPSWRRGKGPLLLYEIVTLLVNLFKLNVLIFKYGVDEPGAIISDTPPNPPADFQDGETIDRMIVRLMFEKPSSTIEVLWPTQSEFAFTDDESSEKPTPSPAFVKPTVVKSPVVVNAGVAHETESDSDEKSQEPRNYETCMKSYRLIKWKRDVERRKSSLPLAGKGLFAVRYLGSTVCVAAYPGNLVSDDGVVMQECPHTQSLFHAIPALPQRPWSASHCAKIKGRRSNLMVDGTHHACSDFDNWTNRNNLPWGSCLNSSVTEAKVYSCSFGFVLVLFVYHHLFH